MERVSIDARSAAIGGVAGLGIGGAVGWLLCRHILRRRLEDEIVSLKLHYDHRLDGLQTRVSDFERTARLQARQEAMEFARAHQITEFARANQIIQGSGYATGDLAAKMAERGDGDSERIRAMGLEGLEDGDGSESGDPETGWPGAGDDAVSEVAGDSGTDSPAGGLDHKPYVISLEEFCDPPEGRSQVTVTYYAADNTLADDQSEPIPNIETTVGPLSPLDFGGISKDAHIRYVRNNHLDLDFEIILSSGSYSEEVLNYGRPRNPTEDG